VTLSRVLHEGEQVQHTLEIKAITRYADEQGLTVRELTSEDLFVASTLDLAKK
jgi:hypothetical protein